MYDIVLCNGMIVDGTGKKPYTASLGIKGNKIKGIAQELPEGRHKIDINGLAITPGFIDIHSHSDCSFLVNERSESKVFQGVTTEVTGCCGISMVPNKDDTLGELKKYVAPLLPGVDTAEWNFTNLTEYAEVLNKKKLSINCAPQIGHGALRLFVMGFDNRAPNSRELALLKEKLAEELAAGAWGLSAGLIYPPGSFSATEELIELAHIIAKHEAVFSVHIRGESDTVFQAIEEMIEVGKVSGARIEISHLKLMGKNQWGRASELLELIKKARGEGVDMWCDQYPYRASSTYLSALVPKWAQAGGVSSMLQTINGTRAKEVLVEIEQEMERRGGAERVVFSCGGKACSSWESKTIAEISRELNLSYGETVVRILNITKGTAKALYYSMDEEDVKAILQEKHIAVGSDGYAFSYSEENQGKPHPRSFGTFPRVLKKARDYGMDLEEAVYKMTGLPASIMGFKDRGILKENYRADLVIFDPQNIADIATFTEPFVKPVGIKHVLVAGEPVILNGKQTDAYPGRVLLKNKED